MSDRSAHSGQRSTVHAVVAADRGHQHGHGPPGGHAGHSHGPSANADRRLLSIALALIVGFMAVEVVIGLIASSLALIADAGHMLSDAAAIGLALVAMRLAARPAAGSYTYGLRRAEILSAQANGLTLLLLAVFFTVESIRRLVDPPAVEGGLVLAIALVGVVVNLAATWVLSKANRQSLNVEGSFQHILTDLYAFIGTAIAGLVVVLSGWDRADPIASLLVAALMTKAGLGLVRESGRIFLEASPRGIDPAEVDRQLRATSGVVDLHELHIWEVSSGFPALSAHVLVAPQLDCHRARQVLEAMLADRFAIDHTTLQVDHREDLIAEAGIPLRSTAPRVHLGHSGPVGATGDHSTEDSPGNAH